MDSLNVLSAVSLLPSLAMALRPDEVAFLEGFAVGLLRSIPVGIVAAVSAPTVLDAVRAAFKRGRE